MKTNYQFLENKIGDIQNILYALEKFSNSLLSSEEISLVDRFYFWHISEIINEQQNLFQDLIEQVTSLQNKSIIEKKQYLLTK